MKKQRKYWTEEECMNHAKKYKTRSDFQFGSNPAYQAAYRMGILDKVCKHMVKKKTKPYRYWTEERILAESKKYKFKKDFREKSHSAFVTAHKMGILEKICEHMKLLRPGKKKKK